MKRIRTFIFGVLALAAGISMPTVAQEPLLTNRATELRTGPDDSAALVKQLAERAPVELQERKGAWSRVKSGSDVGWVRMMHLRGGATVVVDEKSSSGGFFAGFSRLLGGGGSRGNQRAQSATVGIRGITEEDLKNADPNPAAFSMMKSYRASDSDARLLASQGKLAFRSVAYLAQDANDAAAAAGGKK